MAHRLLYGLRNMMPPRSVCVAFACGVLSVLAAVLVLNNTPLADHLVAPLIRSDTKTGADAIVVLGGGLVGNCEPNIHTLRRVILGSQLYRAGRAPVLLLTGGPGRGVSCSVATVMADFASQLGVPSERMRLETSSHSTHANAEMSAPLLRGFGAERVLIVTDRLHMRRAEASFRHFGFLTERASVPVYAAHPDNVSMLLAAGREYVALGYYSMRGWLTPAEPAAHRPSPQNMIAQQQGALAMSKGPANPNGPVVVLGASYAGGWRLPPIAGHAVINKGVQGQQSWELAERFDRDVLAHAPRAVIIWGFINDVFRAPAGQEDAAMERVKASFIQMIERAKTLGIEPIVATEATIRAQDSWSESLASWAGWVLGKTSYQDRINTRVGQTNDWLRSVAQERQIRLLDLNAVLSGPGGERRKEFAKDDGSHITEAGYQALTAYATAILEKHFTTGS